MGMANFFRAESAGETESGWARYSDLFLVGCIIMSVGLIILPLPPVFIDVMVAISILTGLLMLLMAIYISGPLDFSVFPSLLPITTVFRVTLSIATTKMILQEGDAGQIIDTFGSYVAGGSLVVGLVVFLIITVVQFIVIAKGGERVAEVAARFSLDAMPGKQLSIDSDLRANLISKDEAKQKRRNLELESKLHGSLDGAMKFVKGDAIAGLVITLVNLIGGLAIGVMVKGMDFGAAMQKYSVLTIGDGLVASIPALFCSIAAALIVTRATDEEKDKHLGEAVRKQIAAKPRVLLVAGGICLLLAVIPGFPMAVFAVMAIGLGLIGVFLTPELRAHLDRLLKPAGTALNRPEKALPDIVSVPAPEIRAVVPLLLEVRPDYLGNTQRLALSAGAETLMSDMQLDLGIVLPGISLHVTDTGGEDWRLLAFEAPLGSGGDGTGQGDPEALIEKVRALIRRNLPLFVGIQEASEIITRANARYPDIVKELLRAAPLSKIAEVLRRLLAEEVPVRDLRALLEGLAEHAQRENDPAALAEHGRRALARHIRNRYAPDGRLAALTIDQGLENRLRELVRQAQSGEAVGLRPEEAQALLNAIVAPVRRDKVNAIVVAPDLRAAVRQLIAPDLFDVAVLSPAELVPAVSIDVRGNIGLPAPQAENDAARALPAAVAA
ncbi:FHIPEP family type III secretion protein [Pacificimonas sp. WHA3]|uniref:FHIPEP family type III secretion protein n=1 Tax=Pacificimonas pallii TaxID=2827236 RepID=A0ABS6SEX5_9SPHN|nr:flagellar biosynthesis protein FlhA [Pacificimonas pallii]MBV7256958.1 FHIPEP family type III secretion protein [Pacificimonas pallii]